MLIITSWPVCIKFAVCEEMFCCDTYNTMMLLGKYFTISQQLHVTGEIFYDQPTVACNLLTAPSKVQYFCHKKNSVVYEYKL